MTEVVRSALELTIVVVGVVGAVFAFLAARRSRLVNDAVNHRHAGEPRLLDLVRLNRDDIREIRAEVVEARRDISSVRRDVADHISHHHLTERTPE